MNKGVLVIGGGIAGVQAALDLANAGVKTYLVEKSPSLGGKMAQLDKTFPTNDCSMCILSPKLVEAGRHPNIEILANSELLECQGKAGEFKVKILKHARYIDEEKCTGCGTCAEKCPKKVPSEFDMGMTHRKAIYIPFPQAVPLIYTIDSENCTYFLKGKCRLCEKACLRGAIDFEQKDIEILLDVGAIIVATGYDILPPSMVPQYKYDQYVNIISSLEFERLMSASGPTQGKILRPSDGKPPKSVVFIQCVGSRDVNRCSYCSAVCCMHSIKEAMIAKEHDPNIEEMHILYMDIRAYGKHFENYYLRAKDEILIDFVKGKPAEIIEDPDTNDILVRVGDIKKGETMEIKGDLVILSTTIIPNKSNGKLAEILGIQLDENGFFKERHINALPVDSTKPGISLAGCALGPKDIPDSVAEASAAASRTMLWLKDVIEREEIKEDITKPEEGGEPEELRIGVFVCRCGINIGGIVDVPKVVEHANTLPYVVYAEENLYTCSEDSQTHLGNMIKEKNLNRVVIASCTPKTHEPIFRDTCEKAGLNPFLFEMANIRDQCSWVHMQEPEKATEKAKDLISMVVAKAAYLQPLYPKSIEIERSALVIGGGIAGMRSAIDLANMGFDVNLVEKAAYLGGRVAQLGEVFPESQPSHIILDRMYQAIDRRPNIKVHLKSEVTNVEGYLGNFEVEITQRARGVDIEKCDACGRCEDVCPVTSHYLFDRRISTRKAIYMHPNSWPKSYNIVVRDCNQCGKCAEVCPTGAITPESIKYLDNDFKRLKAGTVVLAIGSDVYDPQGEYCYEDSPDSLEAITVISNIGLERLLNPEGPTKGEIVINDREPKSIAFIMCVGSRDPLCERLFDRKGTEGIGDCSRYCCKTTMKQAIQLKKMGINVMVLYRDIRTYGKGGEEMYRKACELGVQFIKYEFNNKPKVEDLKGSARILVFDELSEEELELNVDTVILVLGMVAHHPDTSDLLRHFKVTQCGSGFCMEKHIKLAPIEASVEGIYLAGCLQSPKNIAESLVQGSGAAMKAAIPMIRGFAQNEPITSWIDEERCIGCKTCEQVCPYGAIQPVEGKKKMRTMEALCQGCGSCAAACPERAITMNHYTLDQLIAQGLPLLEEEIK
ncbi:MAG: CoB--CoM heterodisulfide reductase iron-sulfur subunit A family protein [Thermoplasmata archaeon]|nr:MAG: CoB--CoM heterodisulfide reductase iron-sulfur subunit A family protein [Thermoplasmata archaeon]